MAYQSSDCAIKTTKFFDNNVGWNVFVLLVTIYVLIIAEICILFVPAKYDIVFVVVDILAFCLFFGEWLVKAILAPHFTRTFGSFSLFFPGVR